MASVCSAAGKLLTPAIAVIIVSMASSSSVGEWSSTREDRAWWAYQPIDDPPLPNVDDNGWCRNEIDCFIYARLAQAGIRPAPPADPRRLRRRVCFAVTGLPPDESLLTAEHQASQSYERIVDALLDDPAYGENQARFWLDLVRYADSDGYKADHARPDAHLYRDYVIRSFNNDKPYDRFALEQLAGDEVDPGNRDALIATMYLRHGIYEYNQRDVELQWQQILNDITETTADVFLAQGLKCARCHDHKFDSLLQRDFFRFRAFFSAYQPRENMPVADLAARTAYFKKLRDWEEATADIRRRLHEIENPVLLRHAAGEGFDKFVGEIRSMISKHRSERTPYEHQIASLASRQFELQYDKLSEWLDPRAAAEQQRLKARLAEFEKVKPAPLPTLGFVASDVGPVAPPTFIPDDPRRTPVAPGFFTILDPEPARIIPPPAALQSTGRRTVLARWIVNPANPLTARVIVNRLWQQHFGRGLVETTNDFGQLGEPPSHPELLDWLASRFMEDGWGLKKLHRRILTSATYRQTTVRPIDARLATLDPDNHLLWRMNPRRLSGEEIHDAILSASEELKEKGRAIYQTVRRNHRPPLLAAFDMPDRIRSCGKRYQTTTPSQALLLTNGSWAYQRARTIARRLAATGDNQFVQSTYRAFFSRDADRIELAMAREFIAAYASITEMDAEGSKDPVVDVKFATANGPGRDSTGHANPVNVVVDQKTFNSPQHKGRIALIHTLMNSNEMIHVD